MNRDDIARLAGVSSATVSRVINNHKSIRPEVRARVLQIMNEYNYKPNVHARSLKMDHLRTLVFFAPNIRIPYFSEIYKGITDHAESCGYLTVIHDNSSSTGNLDLLVDGKVDGVITGHTLPKAFMEKLEKNKIPVVFLNTASRSYWENSPNAIKLDMFKATLDVLEYLFSMGHRKIGMIHENIETGKERLEAYKSFHKMKELPYREQYIKYFYGVEYDYKQGYDCMSAFLNEKTDITAVVANNDLIAIGAMRAVCERGMHVPGDFSFVGYDDIPVASYYNPPLTTVRLYEYEQGTTAAKMLLNLIEGIEVRKVEISTELVIRETVARI